MENKILSRIIFGLTVVLICRLTLMLPRCKRDVVKNNAFTEREKALENMVEMLRLKSTRLSKNLEESISRENARKKVSEIKPKTGKVRPSVFEPETKDTVFVEVVRYVDYDSLRCLAIEKEKALETCHNIASEQSKTLDSTFAVIDKKDSLNTAEMDYLSAEWEKERKELKRYKPFVFVVGVGGAYLPNGAIAPCINATFGIKIWNK